MKTTHLCRITLFLTFALLLPNAPLKITTHGGYPTVRHCASVKVEEQEVSLSHLIYGLEAQRFIFGRKIHPRELDQIFEKTVDFWSENVVYL